MKNLILASILGSAAAGFAVPALTGPVHFAITRPYSMFGLLPSGSGQSTSVTLGTVPLDFVLTDVMVGYGGGVAQSCFVLVNGNRVFGVPGDSVHPTHPSTHMTTGIFIPAGSTVGFEGAYGSNNPITLAGYVQ